MRWSCGLRVADVPLASSDHEGEILDMLAQRRRNKRAAR
jgi:hypothetical protein